MSKRIRISWPGGSVVAALQDTPSSRALVACLPFKSVAQTWGDEVYFGLPISVELEAGARQVVEPGTVCVGSGARRFRTTLEGKGAIVPPDADERHVPHARHHAALARDFGPVEDVLPIYVREPDAKVPS